jgi:hypothetical protein
VGGLLELLLFVASSDAAPHVFRKHAFAHWNLFQAESRNQGRVVQQHVSKLLHLAAA